jgi:hypothetical protein
MGTKAVEMVEQQRENTMCGNKRKKENKTTRSKNSINGVYTYSQHIKVPTTLSGYPQEVW